MVDPLLCTQQILQSIIIVIIIVVVVVVVVVVHDARYMSFSGRSGNNSFGSR